MQRKWIRRGCVVALAFSLLPAGTGAAAATLGPGPQDMRRGGVYGVAASAGAACDVSPAQDLELEWNGSRIAWESVEAGPGAGGASNIRGTYRVPRDAELGGQQGPEVFCWNSEHTQRTSLFALGGGASVYDASVSPGQTPAGGPVTVEGHELPSACGDQSVWSYRLSVRFDGQPRPWTAIDGSRGSEGGNLDVTIGLLTPAGASPGAHEWSIWCRGFNNSSGYGKLWEATVQVTAAVAGPAPVLGASASASASAPAPTASPSPAPSESPQALPSNGSTASAGPTPAPSPTTVTGAGWPRTGTIKALPRMHDLTWPSPWLLGLLLLLAMLIFLLIGFPSELFNKTFEENETAIRQWLRLPPKRDRNLHRVRWPIVTAAVIGGAALMALAEPSPILSRETLVTVLALVVAVPVTGLVYSWVMERHAGRTGRLKPVYPAIVVAVLCALLSRFLHFVPGYVYGLIIAYAAVTTRVPAHRRHDGAGVLKATAILFATAMVSWAAWQVWFAAPAGAPTGFVMRWADTTVGYIALIGLEAPLLGLLPLRFMDGRSLWRWSKPLWLSAYLLCLAAFVIVLMDFGATGSEWSALIAAVVLFAVFGLLSVAFWSLFALRARRDAHAAPGPQPR